MMSTRDSVIAAHYVGVHIIRVRPSLCVLPQSLRPILEIGGKQCHHVPSCDLTHECVNHATLIESTSLQSWRKSTLTI